MDDIDWIQFAALAAPSATILVFAGTVIRDTRNRAAERLADRLERVAQAAKAGATAATKPRVVAYFSTWQMELSVSCMMLYAVITRRRDRVIVEWFQAIAKAAVGAPKEPLSHELLGEILAMVVVLSPGTRRALRRARRFAREKPPPVYPE